MRDLRGTDPRMLSPPPIPLDLMWWPPWQCTDPWRFHAFRGGDEWHNPSWALIVPLLGGFILFRMRYRRDHLREHLNLWTRDDGWEGLYVIGCPICAEIYHCDPFDGPGTR